MKSFLRAVRMEMDKRYAVQFPSTTEFTILQSEVAELQNKNKVDVSNFVERDGDKVLSSNDYTDAEKALLAQLADDTEGFTETDLEDIFN